MEPTDMVCLAGNHLVLKTIDNEDDYLWPEGILNLAGHSFIEIIMQLKELYGVSIVIDRNEAPVLDVVRGFLWDVHQICGDRTGPEVPAG